MKSLLKKPWFLGTLIFGLTILVFFMNLWIMSLSLASPYEEDTIFKLASNFRNGGFIEIFSFVLMIVFYTSIAPVLFTGFSLLRKNGWGILSGVIYFLGYAITLIVYQTLYRSMTIFQMVLVIISIIFVLAIFVFFVLRNKIILQNKGLQKDEIELKLSATKIPLVVLIIDIISMLVFFTTFIIPIYSLTEGGNTYFASAMNVIFGGDTSIQLIVYFLVNFGLFLALFLYFTHCLSFYFFDKERFILKSNTYINVNFIATILFFLLGLTIQMYYTLLGSVAQTFAYIPMLLMIVVIFILAIIKGKYNAFIELVYVDSKIKYAKIEPLAYVVLMTATSVLMLLLHIVKISIIFDNFTYSVDLTGFEILRDYTNLDPGYRIVAYILVVMLIAVGISLIVTITSYLSKYRQFSSIVKFATGINMFFIFIIAISGYYFQIAQTINQQVIFEIFAFYGINLPSGLDYDYQIGTDAMYALIAATTILSVMYIRKAFDQEPLSELAVNQNPLEANQENVTSSSTLEEDTYQNFDPCPAFSVLDSNMDEYKADLERRKTFKAVEPSLNDLVLFVVDYARNSRLHLSYTPEDIATFVAGLGATKLSILQGMSGTGKTSLPKIFSEAVFANCDIIEVESSWKDKNELLGYYNEFSMKYTPKKFTLALYKAALNQEILTFILLDEMNLSRIEYYFSDFLSLMENEENQRELKLINIKLNRKEDNQEIDYLALENGNTLKVPPNVWFIGTANRDESTFVISDKVYDRAHTMNFTKRAPKVRNYTHPLSQKYYDYQSIDKLFKTAKQNGNFDAENSELIKQVEVLLAPFNISFGNRILKQIEDFVNIYKACFPNEDVESEAIEKILLSKVVAKLEVKTIDDKEKLEMEFEKLNLGQCVAFIKRLDNE
ncbi:MAG: hypothetical protein C4537_04350 [Acholeplasma sp.]|nr:MAG: hypothetical protein C4537_04350 [Acholeplasma sp.]